MTDGWLGYTYEYLGPENLASTTAGVKDGVLGPDGPAYKALVLYGQTRITPSASAALLRLAEAGLPIFVVGPAPNITIGLIGQRTVSTNMGALLSGKFSSVTVLSAASFGPLKLQEKEILPRISASNLDTAQNSSQLYSQWHSRPESSLELVYLLNRGPKATFDISFAVSEAAVPYILDAWTGEQSRLPAYLRTRDGITTRLSLSQQQSTVVAFKTEMVSEGEDTKMPVSVVSRSPNIARLRVTPGGNIEGLIDDNDEASVLLSNNKVVEIPSVNSTIVPSSTLGPWTLTFESYSAPLSLTTASVAANRTFTTIASPLRTLTPWTKIPGLERSSGIGTYRTTYRPARLDNSTAITIHFTGAILNTIRVRVNGNLVPAIDLSAPEEGRDITSLLRESRDNEIVVETTSTLFNAVKARVNDLRTIGNPIHYPKDYSQPAWKEFGLVGEVVVRTWRRVVLEGI